MHFFTFSERAKERSRRKKNTEKTFTKSNNVPILNIPVEILEKIKKQKEQDREEKK